MIKKRGIFLIFYIAFVALGVFFSLDDYCIFRTNISSDSDIIIGILHLILVYGITFYLFGFLIHKITHASYGIITGFIIISIPVTLILDQYIYSRDHFPKLFNFFHDEFQVYVFILFSSVLTLCIFPIYLIGKKTSLRKKAIEKATGRSSPE